jgi:hypothetical protein
MIGSRSTVVNVANQFFNKTLTALRCGHWAKPIHRRFRSEVKERKINLMLALAEAILRMEATCLEISGGNKE